MTDKTDNSGSAFPNDGAWANGVPEPGLTKREYFAGQAFLAFISNPNFSQDLSERIDGDDTILNIIANLSIKSADALLAALKGGE